MAGKKKSLATIAAEEVSLVNQYTDDELKAIHDHVSAQFEFVSKDYRVHFYNWLNVLDSKFVKRSPHPSKFKEPTTESLMIDLDQANEITKALVLGDLKKCWNTVRPRIRSRIISEVNNNEVKKILPISLTTRGRERFHKLKKRLSSKSNEDLLVNLMDSFENIEAQVKARLDEESKRIREKNKKLNQKINAINNRKWNEKGHARRLADIEFGLDYFFKKMKGKSFADYIKAARLINSAKENFEDNDKG